MFQTQEIASRDLHPKLIDCMNCIIDFGLVETLATWSDFLI